MEELAAGQDALPQQKAEPWQEGNNLYSGPGLRGAVQGAGTGFATCQPASLKGPDPPSSCTRGFLFTRTLGKFLPRDSSI